MSDTAPEPHMPRYFVDLTCETCGNRATIEQPKLAHGVIDLKAGHCSLCEHHGEMMRGRVYASR